MVVVDPITRTFGINNLKVKHPIYFDTDIVLSYATLSRNINCFFLSRVLVCYALNKGQYDMKTSVQGSGILTESLYDKLGSLGNYFAVGQQNYQNENG